MALLWAGLNWTAPYFEIRPGLAFFFPAAALTVLAGSTLGWLGALAVMAANFVTPWGAAVGPLRTLLFGLPESLWALLLVWVVKQPGSTFERLSRFLGVGLFLGSLGSAILGGALLTYFEGPQTWAAFAGAVGGWWIPDLVAAVSFGLPILVLVRPGKLLSDRHVDEWRRWTRRRSELVVLAALIVVAALVMVALARLTDATVHWFVALLLPPVLIAAMRGGIGAGIAANGMVSAVYLALVLVSVRLHQQEVLPVLASSYANLVLFALFALMAGVLAAGNRMLADRVSARGEEVARGLESTVEALAAAIDRKDRSSAGHLKRVAKLAVVVGRELGMNDDDLVVLRRAAILHDVGKIGISESVLNKAGQLSAAEREEIAKNVEIGTEILEKVEFLKPVAAIVRHYQERWDGDKSSRYPAHYGVPGPEVPLGARIIRAAEAYDAMTHDRPYRSRMTRQSAVAELWRCSGAQFDPTVVASLTRVLREEWDISGDGMPPVLAPTGSSGAIPVRASAADQGSRQARRDPSPRSG